MTDLIQNKNSNVQVVVSLAYLREFAIDIVNEALAKNPEDPREMLLSVDEVAKKLGVNRSTLWRWANNGYLTPIKVGRKPKYKESDLSKLLNGGL